MSHTSNAESFVYCADRLKMTLNRSRCEIENRLKFEESPIENLLDEVLLEILEYLDARSMKEATLVCQK